MVPEVALSARVQTTTTQAAFVKYSRFGDTAGAVASQRHVLPCADRR